MTSGRRRTIERHLDPEALDAAIGEARKAGAATRLQRLCFVKNCYAGDSATEAARRVGVSRTTGSRWLDRWNEAGIEGLEPANGGGRPSKLGDGERGAARDALADAAPLSTAAAGALLREEFGVAYATGYLPRLMRSLGFRSVEPATLDQSGTEAAGLEDGEGSGGGHEGGGRRPRWVPASWPN